MSLHQFHWPLEIVPQIHLAGRYVLTDSGFAVSHVGPTHAIHLHTYHCSIRIGGREYRLVPGSVTITPAGVASSYDLQTPGQHWCIHFFPCRKVLRDKARIYGIMDVGHRMAEAEHRFRATTERFHQPGQPIKTRQAAGALLLEMLIWLSELSSGQNPDAEMRRLDQAVAQARQMILQDITATWRVAELSRQFGLSSDYLARRFKVIHGESIAQFLASRRIELACYLLRCTDAAIKSIGIQVGIPDPQYFNKQFRRAMGFSPMEYRMNSRT